MTQRTRNLLALLALAPLLAGCPQYADPTAPEPIRRLREPATEQRYLLYVPSTYDPAEPVPLVVLCHGTLPWDSPMREIRDWVKLAEEQNFIVAAPRLTGTRGDFAPPPDKQILRQRADENVILGTVRHIRGGYNIDPTEIFLSGWSAGGFAVLHTGLKHPEIFRALAVIQGNFNAAFLSDVSGQINPYQPVYVIYSPTDVLTGGQAKECIQWLYDENAYVIDGKIPGPHRSHPQLASEFFQRIVAEYPFLQIRAFAADPQDPFTVQFKTRASFRPEFYDWSFGDGAASPVASPEHTYAEAGRYQVTLVATTADGGDVRRSVLIDVPQTTFEHNLAD